MRLFLLVVSLTIMACIHVEASEGPKWQDLLDQADSLGAAGQLDSANVVVDEAMTIALTEYGPSDTTVGIQFCREGVTERMYFRSYADAESLYSRVASLKEEALGGKHPEVAEALADLGSVYGQQRKYEEARSLYERVLLIREETLGSQDPDVGRSLRGLASAHRGLANSSTAETLYRRSVVILEHAFGPEHPDVAVSLHNLATVYKEEGNLADAESLFKRSLAIKERALGPEHPDVAIGLNNLGNLYSDQGNYAEAEPLQRRALAIKEKALGPEDPTVATGLVNLSNIFYRQGKYVEAESLYRRALAIYEKALGPQHPDVARCLHALANICYYQGKYAEAESLYRCELAIREKALGPQHPHVVIGLNSLAVVCGERGKYAEAESLYRRALAIREEALGPQHPDVARCLHNLAILHSYQGKYAEAEQLLRRALAILEQSLGPEHPHVAGCVNSLALVYSLQGEFVKAEPLHRRALAACETSLGPEHPRVATSLNNLASLYHKQGQYAEAEPLNRRSLAILEQALGPEHPHMGYPLSNLANLCRDQGKHAEAEALYGRLLAVRARGLGDKHPHVAGDLEDMCQLYRLQGRGPQAVELADRACRIRQENFMENAIVLSEKDALTYSRFLRNSVSNYLTCFSEFGYTVNVSAERPCDIVFSCKGQVSDEILERQQSLVQETDSTALILAGSLRLVKFQLSKLFVAGPGEDIGEYRAEVDSLSSLANDLEADLSRHSASFRRKQDYKDISTARTTRLLPENSALVEYIKYDYSQLTPEEEIPRYLVAVISADGEPVIIELGDASDIDALITQYRDQMLQVSSAGRIPTLVDKQLYEQVARDLYRRVWKPIEGYVKGKELVLIAPDGALNMISFAGLTNGDGEYLIEKFAVHYLSSGRDVIRLKDEVEPGIGLLALGDPDYDALVSAHALEATADDSVLHVARYSTRNVCSGCGDLKDITVSPLPGTRKEVELISSNWKESIGEPLFAHFGREASEDVFKSAAPGKRVIHVATHGYYLEGACEPEQPKIGFESDIGFVGENPLLLSGLFFAGANLHGEGADSLGIDDGILTAYEVSAMDLSGTQMVVLSACETGLGKVEEGEGVYGLRRAFQMAGARTVISALWPVSDEATADMMSQLYERRDESIPETMHRIQLEKINELRRNGQPDHPYTWAGFIAIGDWR